MEGIGSEVSQKIRAAIKAKLIELGAYVDDELPDYIMVMVANKRTKSQMDEDLQLFLTSNTKIFTTWLHTVLQKLQEVTVASFENKKESESKKGSKKKKTDVDSDKKSRKDSEEIVGKSKKHSKKHKEGKKSKKNKHKSKEKIKVRPEKREKNESKEKATKETDDEENADTGDESGKEAEASHKSGTKCVKSKSSNMLNDAVGKAILGDLKKNKRLRNDKNDSSSDTSSSSLDSTNVKTNWKENEGNNKQSKTLEDASDLKLSLGNEKKAVGDNSKSIQQPIEDEFNIEPLKPSDSDTKLEETSTINVSPKLPVTEKEPKEVEMKDEKTVSVPTEELLKEHNKLLREKQKVEEKNEKNEKKSESEESISPEEMRKQLLLSRAKKKLENSKLAERMRSNSPDVLILEETSKPLFKEITSEPNKDRLMRDSPSRSRMSPKMSPRRMRSSFSPSNDSSDKSPHRKGVLDERQSKLGNEERRPFRTRITSPVDHYRERSERRPRPEDGEKRKNVIKISESLEMEKNMGVRKEVPAKKRSISSRVITITDPEAPEIPSIVKVKPREFMAKEKQANKALILKAVADAEKSIATLPARIEPEPEPKKPALFTKNLRGKRYEKLAVTLSNIRKSPDSRDRLNRRLSVDSDKSDRKLDSSELSEGVREKSDLLSRKVSRSEDQFISCKTTVMEKNDKYIRCWLEEVEKAVKDDEMINPNDMEDLIIQSNFALEENEVLDDDLPKTEIEGKRKRLHQEEVPAAKALKNQKLSETDIANLRVIPNPKNSDDGGPQIVVTLDGLDSKTIKEIISRNKEAINGPILLSRKETEEGIRLKSSEKSGSETKKAGFEKISDRFGRLNKTNEDESRGRTNESRKGAKHTAATGDQTEKNSTKSKNRELIAQLSEKFGKVDRKFENKKRRYPEEERRYLYESRKADREDGDRNGKYKKLERRSNREGVTSSPPISKFPSSASSQICKFGFNCKNLDCRYYHPKKCRFDDECTNPDCKYAHSETSCKRKSLWYSKS